MLRVRRISGAAGRGRNSGDKTQFTILKGRYFIHVNNFDSDESLVPVMVKLARLALDSIPEEDHSNLFDALPKTALVSSSERLIRGPYALQPVFTFGDGDILQLKGKIFGLVADYKDARGDLFTRIIIPYPDDIAASAALRHLLANRDPYIKVLEQWERGFIFEDFQKKYGRVEIEGERLDCLVNLSEKPGKPRSAFQRPFGFLALRDIKTTAPKIMIPPNSVRAAGTSPKSRNARPIP